MAEWIREGTRLPEVLSRVLFLEETVEGARVLLVGDAHLAPFLLELGAHKVVCALDSQDALDSYRAAPSSASVDFRFLRPGVLPGDDGAFDLVIDFDLPAALARGSTYRLTDINRVLSDDGYALAAVEDGNIGGIRHLFDEDASASSSALYPERLTYRGFAQAVTEEFELVQVFFQSLLLGFFFGSFDADPGEDGIAPHTGLMGDEAEPATAYLFAFGNAVPEIDDVSLVQLPLEELLRSRDQTRAQATVSSVRRAPNAELTAAPNLEPVPEPVRVPVLEQVAPRPRLVEDERTETNAIPALDGALLVRIDELENEGEVKDAAILELTNRLPGLKDHVDGLIAALEARLHEREELLLTLEQLRLAVQTRDAHIDDLRTQRDQALASDIVDEEIGRRLAVALAERDAEMAKLRDALNANATDADDQKTRLSAALTAAEARLETLAEDARDAVNDAVEFERTQHIAVVERVQEQVSALDIELQTLRGERSDLRETLAAREAEASDHEAERTKLALGVQALMKERATRQEAQSDGAALEEERTAIAVERESFEERESVLRAEVARHKGRAATLAEAFEQKAEDDRTKQDQRDVDVTKWRQAFIDSEAAQKAAVEKYRAAQAALSERSRELGVARETFAEVAGQRDTLQQVLDARSQESDGNRLEIAESTAENQRLLALVDERDKNIADLNATIESERTGADTQRRAQAHLQTALEDSTATATAAAAERSDVVGERDAALSERDELRVSRDEARAERNQAKDEFEDEAAEHERTRDELGAATNALEEVADVVLQLRSAAETADNELVQLRDENARLGAFEVQAQDLVAELSTLKAALHATTLELDAEQTRVQLLGAQLDEAQTVLEIERSRGELFGAQLVEAQQALDSERASAALMASTLEEAQGVLSIERARADLFLCQLIEAQEQTTTERARGELFLAQLEEAQRTLATAAVERDLFGAELEEAQRQLVAGQSVLSLQQALLDDARRVHQGTEAQAELFASKIEETRGVLEEVHARSQMVQAQLEEAQAAAAEKAEEARLATSFLEESQARYLEATEKAALLSAEVDEVNKAQADASTLGAAELDAVRSEFEARHQAVSGALDEAQHALEEATANAQKKEQAFQEASEERTNVIAADLEQARADRDALTKTLDDKDRAAATEREQVSRDLHEAQSWQPRCEEERSRADQLDAELAQLRESNDANAASSAALEQQIAEARARASALEAELVEANERASEREHERESLLAKTRETADQIDVLQEKIREVELAFVAAEEQREAAEEQLQSLTDAAGDLAAERGRTETALERTKAAEKNLEDAEEALLEIGAERDLLRDASSRAEEERTREHQVFETERSALSTQVEDMERDRQETQARLAEVESNAQSAAGESAALDRARTDLEETTQLLETARAELEARDGEFRALEAARATAERAAETADDNAKRMEAEVAHANAQLVVAQGDASAAESRAAKLESNLTAAKTNADTAEIRASSLGERLAVIERNLGEVEKEKDELHEALSQPVGEPVTDEESTAFLLREELRAEVAARTTAEAAQKLAADELSRLRNHLGDSETRLANAEARAGQAEAQLADIEAQGPGSNDPDTAALVGRVRVLEEALAQKNTEVADKVERINRLTERLVRLDGAM